MVDKWGGAGPRPTGHLHVFSFAMATCHARQNIKENGEGEASVRLVVVQ